MAAIEFDSVSYKMPNGVMALDNVSLKIEEGELVAIVGGNGAGKTTLLKHLNGLMKPSKGEVRIFGKSTKSLSVAQLSRDVGLVFQNSDHQLFSESVKSEIAFGLRNFGFAEEEVEKRIERVVEYYGLSEMLSRAPMTLSGGEKKRLCIATVMAWEPKILALDEPTVGQDYINKMKLVEVVRSLIRLNRTVLIVSHDLEFLWPFKPRTVVMGMGRILADAPADEIYLDSELLEKSGLRQPQLARLAYALGRDSPFADPDEAARWLDGYISRR
ncbi:MAG: ABC transporter ATP-binding protein [Conexivisphaerales archaeon]